MAQAMAMGRTKDAIALGEKAFDLWRRSIGPDEAMTLRAERNLAMDYRQDGNLVRAEALLRDAVERARRIFTQGEYYLGQYESELSEVAAQTRKAAESKK